MLLYVCIHTQNFAQIHVYDIVMFTINICAYIHTQNFAQKLYVRIHTQNFAQILIVNMTMINIYIKTPVQKEDHHINTSKEGHKNTSKEGGPPDTFSAPIVAPLVRRQHL